LRGLRFKRGTTCPGPGGATESALGCPDGKDEKRSKTVGPE